MRTTAILTNIAALWCAGAIVAATPPAAKPDVRIVVRAVSAGTERGGKSAVSSRQLRIGLENRGKTDLAGLKVCWEIYGRDIQTHKTKQDGEGVETVTLPAGAKVEVKSGLVQFTETEGGTKTTGKGNKRRTTGTPDKGRDYAGFVVTVKQGNTVIVRDATNGLDKAGK